MAPHLLHPLMKPAEHTCLPVSPTASRERGPATAFPPLPQETGISKPSPASTHFLRDLFLFPVSYHLLGKGGESVCINKGHYGEIQNQSGFKVHFSKSILDPEVTRTYGSCSSNWSLNLALAYRDRQRAKCKGTRKSPLWTFTRPIFVNT